ncbi:unnamed protein product [Closterium sp. NIES-53]
MSDAATVTGQCADREARQPNSDDAWQKLIRQLEDCFADEKAPRNVPLRPHFTAAARRGDPFLSLPAAVLPAFTKKVTAACVSIDPTCDSNPAAAAALVVAAIPRSHTLELAASATTAATPLPAAATTVATPLPAAATTVAATALSLQGHGMGAASEKVLQELLVAMPAVKKAPEGEGARGVGARDERSADTAGEKGKEGLAEDSAGKEEVKEEPGKWAALKRKDGEEGPKTAGSAAIGMEEGTGRMGGKEEAEREGWKGHEGGERRVSMVIIPSPSSAFLHACEDPQNQHQQQQCNHELPRTLSVTVRRDEYFLDRIAEVLVTSWSAGESSSGREEKDGSSGGSGSREGEWRETSRDKEQVVAGGADAGSLVISKLLYKHHPHMRLFSLLPASVSLPHNIAPPPTQPLESAASGEEASAKEASAREASALAPNATTTADCQLVVNSMASWLAGCEVRGPAVVAVVEASWSDSRRGEMEEEGVVAWDVYRWVYAWVLLHAPLLASLPLSFSSTALWRGRLPKFRRPGPSLAHTHCLSVLVPLLTLSSPLSIPLHPSPPPATSLKPPISPSQLHATPPLPLAALSRLMLPYLFPDLATFATVADLVAHLRTSDAHYRAALPTEDQFLSLCPTELTVDLLEERLAAAEKSILAVGASRGDRRTPFFEGCSPVPLLPSVASAAAVDLVGTEEVGAVSAPCGRRRNCKGKGSKGGGGGGGGSSGGGGGGGGGGSGGGGGTGSGGVSGGGGGSGGSGRGGGGSGSGGGGGGGGGAGRGAAAQRGGFGGSHRQHVPPDPGIAAAALGGSASAAPGTGAPFAPGAGASALSGTAPTEALHTFTLDSGASRSFFRDSTTLTPLSRPVAVSLADPSGGPVLAHSSTILPCHAAPSGLLSGLHLPSFSTNLVSGADLQDAWVDHFTPGGQRVTHCTCSRTGRHLATFTRRPGSSLYTLTIAPPPVFASGQVAASSQVFAAASRSSPASAPCSCRLLSHETLLWHQRLGHPSLPRLRGMASRTLVSGLPRSLPPLPQGPAPTCVPCVEGRERAAPHSSTFPPTEAPMQTLHMDVWGPARVCGQGHERYFLLVIDDYSRYTTVFPLRSKGETEVESFPPTSLGSSVVRRASARRSRFPSPCSKMGLLSAALAWSWMSLVHP